MNKNRLFIILLMVILVLLIPLVGMLYSDQVNWTFFDFIVAGVLLLGTGFLCELVLWKVKKLRHRVVICLSLIAILFLIWAELAVGIFGTFLAGS